MTSLAAARRAHGAHIEPVLTVAPVEVAVAPPPLAIADVH
jgi:hypothetical protein